MLNSHSRKDYLLVLSFLVLSYFYILFYIKNGLLLVGSDRMFHLERMEEAYQSLKNGQLISYISTYSFARIGQAINIFYPSYNLIVFALIHMFIKSNVISFYVYIYIEQFIGLTVAFYSGKVILRSSKAAYLFSLILRFSTYILYNDFARCDIGESWALIFIPITFAGFYLVLEKNSNKGSLILALGLILELGCHILTALITIVFIIICYFIFSYSEGKTKITFFKMFNAGIIFVMGSLCIITPIISTMFSTKVNKPDINVLGSYNFNFSDLIVNSINNTLQMDKPNLGIILGVSLTLGFIIYPNSSKIMKQIYLVSILLTIMGVNVFPWSIFSKTPIAIIQFPWRLLTIIIILLSLYLSDFIGKKFSIKQCIIFTLFILTITCGSQIRFSKFQSTNYPTMNYRNTATNGWGYLLNNNAVSRVKSKNMISSLSSRSLDYLPEKSIKDNKNIFEHKVRVDSKLVSLKNNQIHSGYQNITYNLVDLPHGKRVELPFLIYTSKNYKVFENNREISFSKSSKSTVQLSKPARSKNVQIKVCFYTPILWKIANLISFITVITLSIILIFQIKLRKIV